MKYSQSAYVQNIIKKDEQIKYLYNSLKDIEKMIRNDYIMATIVTIVIVVFFIMSIFSSGFEIPALIFFVDLMYIFSEINRLEDKAYYTVLRIFDQYEKNRIIEALKRR